MIKKSTIDYIVHRLHIDAATAVLLDGEITEEAKASSTELLIRALQDDGAWVQKERTARIELSENDSPEGAVKDVMHYLPRGYAAAYVAPAKGDSAHILIRGYDDHGWTLDGYVIPRLASGLINAKEIA